MYADFQDLFFPISNCLISSVQSICNLFIIKITSIAYFLYFILLICANLRPNTFFNKLQINADFQYYKLFLLVLYAFLLTSGFIPKFNNNPTSIFVAFK